MKKLFLTAMAFLLLTLGLLFNTGAATIPTAKTPITYASSASMSDKGYLWPVEGKIFGRGFRDGHYAVDISAATGTAVYATASGTVTCSSMASASATATCGNCQFKGAGYHVVIRNNDGILAVYAHLSKTSVSKGSTVSAGQKIGEVGSTGNSTGPHLHFALFKGGITNNYALDPLEYTSPFRDIYVTDVTEKSAKIYGILGNAGMSMVSAGIYIGTDTNNMTKITETLNTEGYLSNGVAITNLFYGTEKWYKKLESGTTYYYRVWVNYYGKEHVSITKSFTTKGPHTHKWDSGTVTKSATCSATGVRTYTCTTCGDTKTETIAKKSHTAGSWTVTKSATCTETGTQVKKCTVCSTVMESQTIAKKSHTAGNWTVTKQATCTATGTQVKKCTGCSTVMESQTIAQKEHSWNSGTVTTPATCTQSGVRTYTCTSCNGTKTETIAKKSHTAGNWTVTKQATCTETGTQVKKCTVCSTVMESQTIAKKSHTAGSWTVTKQATCTETGTQVKKCTGCSTIMESQTIAAKGHSWNSGKVTTEATCTKAGVRTYTCTTCNSTKTATIAATGEHIYGSWQKISDSQHQRRCNTCTKTQTETHRWDSGVLTTPPTETKDGITTFTCVDCSATKTQSVPSTHTHSYATTWTSDASGHWHACSCGSVSGKAAHTPGAAATEQSAQLCTVCKYELKPALTHKHSFAGEYAHNQTGHWQVCNCGAKSTVQGHVWDDGRIVAQPDVGQAGEKEYTCVECGRTKTVTLDPLPSTPGNVNDEEEWLEDEEEATDIPWGTVAVAGAVALPFLVMFGWGLKMMFSAKKNK